MTGGKGIDSANLLLLSASSCPSSDSESSSDSDKSPCAFVREDRLGGIHRNLYGSLFISWVAAACGCMIVGVLKSTTYGGSAVSRGAEVSTP